ncbi:unnamed protein product [Prorocentrum cordatum]|uniref:Rieske domain-containing protein n=1 Tax=Prorocentrum cordatum TaxID=2364126 RepID=A0ABN9Y6B0_9DINO|nr:unnamed protein product [Polarella glacialis]
MSVQAPWIRALGSEELARLRAPPRRAACVEVGAPARKVLLAACGDEVLALDARCAHRGGPLEQGDIEDVAGNDGSAVAPTIRCPWHGRRYCLRTGREVSADGAAVGSWPAQRVHTTEARPDGLYVRLSGAGGEGARPCPSDEFAQVPSAEARGGARLPIAMERSALQALLLAEAAAEDTGAAAGAARADGGPEFVPDEFLF